MKKNRLLKSSGPSFIIGIGVLVILMAFASSLRAQDVYRAEAPDIKVSGTSNLHNWSMEAKDMSCSAKFSFAAAGSQPQSLTTLELSVPVRNLKSGESSMDSRAYTALKADKFGTITFISGSAVIVPGQKNQFQVKSTGSMTIAGIAQPVVLTADCQVNPDGSIACNGSQQVKMTDYQIKPPSFMLGALKTGNVLTINFSLTLKNKS
jgi:polyisoprenoid-binding protein YceI